MKSVSSRWAFPMAVVDWHLGAGVPWRCTVLTGKCHSLPTLKIQNVFYSCFCHTNTKDVYLSLIVSLLSPVVVMVIFFLSKLTETGSPITSALCRLRYPVIQITAWMECWNHSWDKALAKCRPPGCSIWNDITNYFQCPPTQILHPTNY